MKKLFNQLLFLFNLVFILLIGILACGNEDTIEPLPPTLPTIPTPPTTPTTSVETDTFSVTTITNNFTSRDGLDGTTIDSEGNIYISNFGIFGNGAGVGREIYKITPEGEKSKFTTFPTNPGGIAVDALDNIYASVGKQIYKITPDKSKSVYATGTLAFSGLTIDEDGNIYSCGFQHPNIQKVDLNGIVTVLATNSNLQGSVGITYHQETQNLFAGNFNNGKIMQVTLDGEVSELTNLGSTIGYLTTINDYLYATMFNQHKIAKVSIADGTSDIIAGTGTASQIDGDFSQATFEKPNGIIGDTANNVLYVSDYVPARLTKIQLE